MLNIPIVKFCQDSRLLNLTLYPKQAEILTSFIEGDYSKAVWALGRRSGKSQMAAIVAVYLGITRSEVYRAKVPIGKQFYILTVANNQDQSRIALGMIRDLLYGSSLLKPLIIRDTADELHLTNGAIFKALPASSRGGRGLACPVVIFDEIAHAIDTDGNASGDSLYNAIAPSLAQFGNLGKVLMLSSPWTREGIFWDIYQAGLDQQELYNEYPDLKPTIQIIQAATWEVNPTISYDSLKQERAINPQMFDVEYGANFLNPVDAYLDNYLVDVAIRNHSLMLSPDDQFRGEYILSLDPAKGGRDGYVACVTHWQGDRLITDFWHEFVPTWLEETSQKVRVNIAEVEDWIISHHASYGFYKIVLDQFNSQSTIQKLRNLQLPIEEITWGQSNKTQAYTRLKELFNSNNIELPNHEKAIKQLKNLSVKYTANQNWQVTGGAKAGVDDYCSALAGAVLACMEPINHWYEAYFAAIGTAFYFNDYLVNAPTEYHDSSAKATREDVVMEDQIRIKELRAAGLLNTTIDENGYQVHTRTDGRDWY